VRIHNQSTAQVKHKVIKKCKQSSRHRKHSPKAIDVTEITAL